MTAKQQHPSWAYMLAGIAIGLFISFLIYLRNLPAPVPEELPATEAQAEKNSNGPKFDFYKILPELEVVIPDLEVKVTPADKTTPPPAVTNTKSEKKERFVLQAGSFEQFQEADKMKATLALLGIEAGIQKVTVDNKTWHRVRIGPMNDRKTLNNIRQQLQKNNIKAIALKISH